MPKISDKAIQMPASPIRKLVPYAETAKKAGKIVYHLKKLIKEWISEKILKSMR